MMRRRSVMDWRDERDSRAGWGDWSASRAEAEQLVTEYESSSLTRASFAPVAEFSRAIRANDIRADPQLTWRVVQV
jgi:hypothetical protein